MDRLISDSNISVSLMTATSVSVPATEGETLSHGRTDCLINDSNVCVSARGKLRQPWTDCLMTATPVSVPATEGETAMDGQIV